MHITSPSRRAVGLVAAGALGIGTAVLGFGGVAQATPVQIPYGFSTAGGDTTAQVPAGYCAIDWTVIGGQGGADGADTPNPGLAAGELRIRTTVTPEQVFTLSPGTAGASFADGYNGGTNAGDSGLNGVAGGGVDGGGGGAATAVTLNDAPYLTAFGGDGAGSDGGLGGTVESHGNGANNSAVSFLDSPSYYDGATDGDGGSNHTGGGVVSGVGVSCDPPSAPVELTATPGEAKADLRFFPGPAATDGSMDTVTGWEYQLSGGSWQTLETTGTGDGPRTATIPGLTNGQQYSVKVHATSASGPGADSDPVTVTPAHTIAAPTNVTATAQPAAVLVTWEPPVGEAGIVGYSIEAYPQSGDENSTPTMGRCETDADARSCLVGVQAGTNYAIAVSAVASGDNYGTPSDPVFSELVPGPTVPSSAPTASGPLTTDHGAVSDLTTGQQITVTGSGFLPGSTVQLIIYSTPTPLGTVVADSTGSFSALVTVPTSLAAGSHSLVASGVDANGAPRYLRMDVTVAAASGSGTGSGSGSGASLAYTGFSIVGPLVGGIAALVIGATLLIVSRRRQVG